MWPYTNEELGWLDRTPPSANHVSPISSPVIAYYIAEGHRLRAEAIAHFAGQTARALGRVADAALAPVAGHGSAGRDEVTAHLLRTPLTSIRVSSELLRDNPDMPADQRERFLDTIIRNSERLTQAIDQILVGGKAREAAPRSAKAVRT